MLYWLNERQRGVWAMVFLWRILKVWSLTVQLFNDIGEVIQGDELVFHVFFKFFHVLKLLFLCQNWVHHRNLHGKLLQRHYFVDVKAYCSIVFFNIGNLLFDEIDVFWVVPNLILRFFLKLVKPSLEQLLLVKIFFIHSVKFDIKIRESFFAHFLKLLHPYSQIL